MLRRRVQKDGSRPAFTLIELLVVVAIIALLISILLPSLQRARELSKRSVCQANLKGMGTAFYTYAGDDPGSDMWPIRPAAPPPATPEGMSGVTYVQGTGGTSFIGTIGYMRGTLGAPLAGDTTSANTIVSTARNLWTLVRMSISTPKSLNCPSDTDSAGNQDQSPQDFWDFGNYDTIGAVPTGNFAGYGQCSYGYQVPYGTRGKPSSDRDQRMVLAADRGPYSPVYEKGAPWPTGSTFPPFMAATSQGQNSVPPYHLKSSDDWKTWNSPNHGGFSFGEGQNVLYAGGSAEWQGKPCIGIGFDNIYTSWSGAGLFNDERTMGRAPGSYTGGSLLVAPVSDTDSMIYP